MLQRSSYAFDMFLLVTIMAFGSASTSLAATVVFLPGWGVQRNNSLANFGRISR